MDVEIPPGRVVVVIDVIRAFTTAAVAFERGVSEIACAPSLDAARDLRQRLPDHLIMGESGGLRPADFDFGNSPFELSTAPLDGRNLIQATSNGTRGLARCSAPAALLAASARNVTATARWITANRAGAPWTLLCTGRTAEDRACADYLADLLGAPHPGRAGEGADAEPSSAELVAGVRAGAAQHADAFARRPASEFVDLADDLAFCCDVDRADFAMVGEVRGDHVVLRPVG